jgi:hypothetical protein
METFSMSRKEVPRAGLLKAALAGRITNAQGARALGFLQLATYGWLADSWVKPG